MNKVNKKTPVPSRIKSEGREFRSVHHSNATESICWRFSAMDMDGAFSFANVKAKTWRRILEKMKEWETMTWGEISGKRDHAIAVSALSPEARNRLFELKVDDIDEVFSLHLSGRERLIGIRNRNIFLVLWWDPEHKVCPVHKKHT